MRGGFRAAVTALACGILAAPALSTPRSDALQALDALRARPHVAHVELATRRFDVLPRGRVRPLSAERSTLEHRVESRRRSSTLVKGISSLRGVRVIRYDGKVFVTRLDRAPIEATGALRRELLDAAGDHLDVGRVTSAKELAPLVEGGRLYRRVHLSLAGRASPVVRRLLDDIAQGPQPATRLLRVDATAVIDETGWLVRFDTRASAALDIDLLLGPVFGPPEEGAPHSIVQVAAAASYQVTGEGPSTLPEPLAVEVFDLPSIIGGSDPPPRRPYLGPLGDNAAISLVRRVNQAYRPVPAVRVRGPGVDVVYGLSRGRGAWIYGTITGFDGPIAIYLNGRVMFVRDRPRCWTRIPFAERSPALGQPAIPVNRTEFFRPRAAGKLVRVRATLPPEFGLVTTLFINPRTRRLVASRDSAGHLTRYTALRRVPSLPRFRPLCTS